MARLGSNALIVVDGIIVGQASGSMLGAFDLQCVNILNDAGRAAARMSQWHR
jgi:hypothetical protein